MRNAIKSAGLVAAIAAVGCTPFEGDGSGSTSSGTAGTGAGGSTSQSSSGSGSAAGGAGGGGSVPETITVVDALGAAQMGLTVFTSKNDGALADTTTTDAAGRAKLDVPSGGSVSLVDPAATRVTTYFGVANGASVRFVRAEARAPANAPKSFSVTTPGSFNGSTTYELSTSCDYQIGTFGSGVTGNLMVTGCPSQNAFDAVLVALGTKPAPTSLGPVLGVVTKTFPYSGTNLVGFVPASATVGRALSASTVPPSAVSAKFRVTGRKGGVRLYHREADMSSGTLVDMPNNVFDGYDIEQTVLFSKVGATQLGRHHLEHATALPATPNALVLPPSPVAPSMIGEADPVAGTLGFALSGAPFADAIVLDATEPAGAWTVVLPPVSTGSVTLPALPPGFDAQKLVASSAASPLVYTVSHVDDTTASSFDELLKSGWAFAGETLDESMMIHTY